MRDDALNRDMSADAADLSRMQNESPVVPPDKEVGPVVPNVEKRQLDDRRIGPRRRAERVGTDL